MQTNLSLNAGERTLEDYSEYTHFINNDPCYYGSDCTQKNADRITDNLVDLIRGEFPGISIMDYDGDCSGGTTGPDENIIEDIDRWVSENWTAAL